MGPRRRSLISPCTDHFRLFQRSLGSVSPTCCAWGPGDWPPPLVSTEFLFTLQGLTQVSPPPGSLPWHSWSGFMLSSCFLSTRLFISISSSNLGRGGTVSGSVRPLPARCPATAQVVSGRTQTQAVRLKALALSCLRCQEQQR